MKHHTPDSAISQAIRTAKQKPWSKQQEALVNVAVIPYIKSSIIFFIEENKSNKKERFI